MQVNRYINQETARLIGTNVDNLLLPDMFNYYFAEIEELVEADASTQSSFKHQSDFKLILKIQLFGVRV